ncbi:hypothetical protein [Streptomyces sp. EN23]|uniref:hypothetical protein n=1 Tax=Streptomyces sp. EN23 TaxID=212774 RepID=UPI0008516744|nr:hypothetical protein [Streptomyces sp. EN23]
MFIRRSTYLRLVGRADAYAQDARNARRSEQDARNEVTRQVALAEVRQADHDRTVAGMAADLAAAERRVARLQAAYDNAVGLDNPTLDLGAHWQTRRADKPRTEVSAS